MTYLTINAYTAPLEEIAEAAIESFADRAVLTPRQKDTWRKQSEGNLRAVVYMSQRLAGLSAAERLEMWKTVEAEGRIRLVGNGAMAHHELVPGTE